MASQQATVVSGSGLSGKFKKLNTLVTGTSDATSAAYFAQSASSTADVVTVTGVATVTTPASVPPNSKASVVVSGYPAAAGLTLKLTEGGATGGKGHGSTGPTGGATLTLKVAKTAAAGTGTLTTVAKTLGLTVTEPVTVS